MGKDAIDVGRKAAARVGRHGQAASANGTNLPQSLRFAIAVRQARGRLFEGTEAVCEQFDLDRAEALGLVLLREGSRTVSELARWLGVRQNAASIVVDRLANRRLARRRRSRLDRRVVMVLATDEGAALADRLRPELTAEVDNVLAHLSEAERDQLIDLLDRVSAPGT